jgi:hypothetical protein
MGRATGFFAIVLTVAAAAEICAQPFGKSDTKVKSTAIALYPHTDGKQVVIITLEIEEGWYIYANPVGPKNFADNQTVVTFTAKEKVTASVNYPEGVVKTAVDENKQAVRYRVYEGKVKLLARVQRAGGDKSPLQVSVAVNACNKNTCLFPATIKLTIQ